MAKRISKREQRRFLEMVSDDGNVSKAAEALGRSRGSYYDLAARDSEFAKALKGARDLALNGLDDAVMTWARDGYFIQTQESKRNKDGELAVVATKQERRIDPRLALRVLERRHPDYKPKADLDVGGKAGVLIVPGIVTSEADFDEQFGGDGSDDSST